MSFEVENLHDLTAFHDIIDLSIAHARHIISNFNDVASYVGEGLTDIKHYMDTCDNSSTLLTTFKLEGKTMFDVVEVIKEKRNCLLIREEYIKDGRHGFYFDYEYKENK